MVQNVQMPRGAKILTVQLQGSDPCLWAMVNPRMKYTELRQIDCYGTGQDVPEPDDLVYIGTTVDMSGSPLVFHFFERVK
jgi:hypothetical protein